MKKQIVIKICMLSIILSGACIKGKTTNIGINRLVNSIDRAKVYKLTTNRTITKSRPAIPRKIKSIENNKAKVTANTEELLNQDTIISDIDILKNNVGKAMKNYYNIIEDYSEYGRIIINIDDKEVNSSELEDRFKQYFSMEKVISFKSIAEQVVTIQTLINNIGQQDYIVDGLLIFPIKGKAYEFAKELFEKSITEYINNYKGNDYGEMLRTNDQINATLEHTINYLEDFCRSCLYNYLSDEPEWKKQYYQSLYYINMTNCKLIDVGDNIGVLCLNVSTIELKQETELVFKEVVNKIDTYCKCNNWTSVYTNLLGIDVSKYKNNPVIYDTLKVMAYIITNINYGDVNNPNAILNSAYQGLFGNGTVCNGYSDIMSAYLNQKYNNDLPICINVAGTSYLKYNSYSNNPKKITAGKHAWVYVYDKETDGYYLCDPTNLTCIKDFLTQDVNICTATSGSIDKDILLTNIITFKKDLIKKAIKLYNNDDKQGLLKLYLEDDLFGGFSKTQYTHQAWSNSWKNSEFLELLSGENLLDKKERIN